MQEQEKDNAKEKRKLLSILSKGGVEAKSQANFYIGDGAPHRDSYTRTWLASEPALLTALRNSV